MQLSGYVAKYLCGIRSNLWFDDHFTRSEHHTFIIFLFLLRYERSFLGSGCFLRTLLFNEARCVGLFGHGNLAHYHYVL